MSVSFRNSLLSRGLSSMFLRVEATQEIEVRGHIETNILYIYPPLL